ncbi:PucR family transcriptional regulator [Nocardioides ginsengisoli]|uniref:PucR family transcriptional regulator n=1 Tax=Nocardioides ginsengisoli TaxID=363868 RepID=A0ABW3W631_9ACTN
MLVEELVRDPELELRVEVEGNLGLPVRWVHIIEVADPGRFLRGGEVVLTAGVWRTSGLTAEQYVARVAEAGVAALGYGLVSADESWPDDVVVAARAHGLTCFVAPVSTPFVAIVERFVATKRSEWEAPLRRQLDHHAAMVSALRAERGVGSVLRVLSRLLGRPVALRAQGAVHGERPEPSYEVAVIGSGLADASLLLPEEMADLDVGLQAAVSTAMPFLALELERERAIRATEQRYALEVLDWIESGVGDRAAIVQRLELLGIPADAAVAALVVRGIGVADVEALVEPGSLVVERPGEVVVVAAQPPAVVPEGLTGYVGVGRRGPADDLRVSILEARKAVETLEARGRPGWLSHDQLASPTLLLDLQDPALLRATGAAVLGPLVAADAERGSDLLHTLTAFLDHGGRWQETADALHVHINTLRHRLKRVEELTGRSLASTADRVDLFLALRVHR